MEKPKPILEQRPVKSFSLGKFWPQKNPSRGRVLGDSNEVNSGCPLGTGLDQTIATTNLGVTKLDQLATNIDNQFE